MSAPNIRTERARCAMDCRRPAWEEVRDAGTGKLIGSRLPSHREGDVRRCEHGTVWHCTGNSSGYDFAVCGFWRQLHPVLDFLRYRRAVRAIEAEARRPRMAIEPLSVAR